MINCCAVYIDKAVSSEKFIIYTISVETAEHISECLRGNLRPALADGGCSDIDTGSVQNLI